MSSLPLPLPDGWSLEEDVQDTIAVEGLLLHRAGLAARSPSGEIITGSAAGLVADVGSRAAFELLERVATCEASVSTKPVVLRDADGAALGTCDVADLFPTSPEPTRYRPARSNGVALHDSWALAVGAARRELIERHRILQSWYGFVAPQRVVLDASWPVSALPSYEWRAYAFDADNQAEWSEGVSVSGVFGIPRNDETPFVVGWGAGESPESAQLRARTEATQVLAFLWGEEIPTTEPVGQPNAAYHLERILYPGHRATLLSWLAGAHTALAPAKVAHTPLPHASTIVQLQDLTPAWAGGRLSVARASHPAATALVFGDPPAAAHLPLALRPHPIA